MTRAGRPNRWATDALTRICISVDFPDPFIPTAHDFATVQGQVGLVDRPASPRAEYCPHSRRCAGTVRAAMRN